MGAIRTRAVYDEASDEWAINGVKTWATNGGIANVHVVVASVDPSLGSRGQATFIVPPGAKGLSQGQKFKKHGVRASHTAEVILDDVRVPGRCLVGGKEKLDRRLARVREGGRGGEQAAMKTFEASRPSVAAMAVGVGRAAVEYAAEYARTRVQFGKPIGGNQGVAFQLADMAAAVDAARLLTWRAAWMARQGKPFEHAEGSMSKLVAGETAVRVTEQAIQILGGNGYTRDYPVERWHRDAKIFTISRARRKSSGCSSAGRSPGWTSGSLTCGYNYRVPGRRPVRLWGGVAHLLSALSERAGYSPSFPDRVLNPLLIPAASWSRPITE